MRAVATAVLADRRVDFGKVAPLLLAGSDFAPEHIVEQNFGPIKERTDRGQGLRLDSLQAIGHLAASFEPADLALRLLNHLAAEPQLELKLKRL